MEAVGAYADACRDRGFLWGFLHGTIENAGDPFHLGDTERAIVEVALRAIGQRKSMVIRNPCPTTSLPVAICASYVYSQHPQIPNSESKRPMLMFPSQGYVTAFDKFHFQNATGYSGKSDVIPREVVNSLTEVGDGWGLYTANTQGGFHFDLDEDYVTPGAVFVDFQKDEWSDYSFGHIEEFCEANPDMPVIFYTDEKCPAVQLTCDRLGIKPLEVTSSLLSTAAHTADPTPGESELAIQERILTNGGVDMRYVSAVDGDLATLLPNLIDLKTKLRDRNLAYIEASRVFNRLTKQPFKPQYWTQRTATDGYWDDVPSYLDRIRTRATNVSGAQGELLINYARLANEVQGQLNERHVLQNVATDAIQRAGSDPDTEYVFVLKNDAEVDAFELAVLDSGYTVPENVELAATGSVSPDPDRPHFILYPPYRDSYLYEFPPSKRVAFLYNDVWDGYVRDTAESATDAINASHASSRVGDSQPGDVTDHAFDIDKIESNIQSHIARTGFSGLNSSLITNSGDEAEDGDGTEDTDAGSGERVVVELANAETNELENTETKRLRPGTHVTTYDPRSATIARTTAQNVERGDHLLLIDHAADDIYGVLIENVHQRDAVRDDESLINDWRTTLDRGMEERGMDASDVKAAIREMGSDISNARTIRQWRSGKTIAPRNEEDVKRIIKLFHPELEGSALNQIHKQVWRSVKHIRSLHQRIGRNVRRVIEAEVNPATTVSFDGGDINQSMVRNIARDIKRHRVVRVHDEQ